jgi:hypothetical protein
MTDPYNNRSRGVRSVAGVGSDCSGAGTAKLSPQSRVSVAERLLNETAGLRSRRPIRRSTGAREPMPIWLAALLATQCLATVNGQDHAVRWDCIAGRAIYTNQGAAAERIEPLGVHLQSGHTLAVYWRPGETNYTLEVYSQSNHYCA